MVLLSHAALGRRETFNATLRAPTPWSAEALRVLLPGRRLVVESERPALPDGVTNLASGQGVWVGEKK